MRLVDSNYHFLQLDLLESLLLSVFFLSYQMLKLMKDEALQSYSTIQKFSGQVMINSFRQIVLTLNCNYCELFYEVVNRLNHKESKWVDHLQLIKMVKANVQKPFVQNFSVQNSSVQKLSAQNYLYKINFK